MPLLLRRWIIGVAAWYRLPGMRTPAGIMSAGVIGGAIVYLINRWALLPPTNPMMARTPQIAFFLTHLLFGLIVGTGLALAFRAFGHGHRPTFAARDLWPPLSSGLDREGSGAPKIRDQ